MSLATKILEGALDNSDQAIGLIKKLIEFIQHFGEDDAEEIITKLLADPPKKANLSELDKALAEWRAANPEAADDDSA